MATAPAAFRAPVFSALWRGTVTWMLVRGLWRACDKAGLSAADAAHVAMVMLADDPATCVPERLAPDGSAATGPWGHGAFWAALDREVSKLATCPDPHDEGSVQAAAAARAAREAAFRARSMWVRVNDDGTAQVGFTGSVLKVLALGDRLDKAARAARGAGDARTVTQLANDIGIALLGHAVIGAHELPDLDIFQASTPTPEDLAAAGWTPQVIAALSALPPAILQVVVPLLALHDPAQAHTLPGVARTVGTTDDDTDADTGPDAQVDADPDAQTDAETDVDADPDAPVGAETDVEAGPGAQEDDGTAGGGASQEAVDVDSEPVADPPSDSSHTGHTGGPGCPACLPSARAARNHDLDETSRQARQDQQDQQDQQDRQGQQDWQDRQDRQDDSAHHPGPGPGDDPDLAAGEGPARDHDRDHAEQEQDPDPDPEKGSARAGEKCRGEDSASPRSPRMVWVGRVLGKQPGFVGPDLVRRLALSPGSTFVRLLVDPADGRCLERSSTSYSFDAAMRAQLAAADVTCRAPGCEHHGGGCQVDHVLPHATGGATKESNAQLLDCWHHDPKTAKAWDAVLHANRDVTWTTTLSRVYRTRVHDYRELVTVIVDALERIAAVEPEDRMDQINLEVYQALCYRAAGERLNEGDDDTYEETHLTRFGGDITIGLSHRDPLTGRRTPGPSPAAQARADAAAATARTTPGQASDTSSDENGSKKNEEGEVDPESNAEDDQPTPRTPWSQPQDDEPPPF